MSDEQNVYDAKEAIKAHIKFLETLLKHLNSNDKIHKARAMFTAWCMHEYLNNQLVKDVENAMERSRIGVTH